jgi:YD repeat-containing protein
VKRPSTTSTTTATPTSWYLSVGEPQTAAQTYGTPEGHAVRYDDEGRIIGITLVNARLLLDRSDIHVTVPQVVDVQADELKLALT